MDHSVVAATSKGAAYVVCTGCPENRMDAARIEKYLVGNGWSLSKNWQDSDLILFNACGRTENQTARALDVIREIQSKKRENQKLIVWGCLPKIDPDVLKEAYDGLVSPGSELSELPQLIGTTEEVNQTSINNIANIPIRSSIKKNAPKISNIGHYFSQIYKKPVILWDSFLDSRFNLISEKDSSIYYIRASTGCRSKCAYCAIRKSRGLTRSKPVAEVVAEFQRGLCEGYTKFSLMGTDLGSYGLDFSGTLVDLLQILTSREGDFKISLRNVNPYHLKQLLSRFTSILRSNKISYIEVPVESGSNRILSLMNRNYTIEEYKMMINSLREACPQLVIRTQMMAGFPTETEEEFQESLRLLDDVAFDYVEAYEFSSRPGTAAAKIEPKVPDDVKHRRFLRLYRKALLNHTPRKIKKIIKKEV